MWLLKDIDIIDRFFLQRIEYVSFLMCYQCVWGGFVDRRSIRDRDKGRCNGAQAATPKEGKSLISSTRGAG